MNAHAEDNLVQKPAESLGTGIKRMVNACKRNKNPIPEFRQEGSMFVVTLKKRAVAKAKKTTQQTTQLTTLKTTLKTKLKARDGLTKEAILLETVRTVLQGNSLRIALLILQKPQVEIEEISEVLDISRDGVNYLLRVLKKSVGLRRIGGRKFGGWEFVLPKRLRFD